MTYTIVFSGSIELTAEQFFGDLPEDGDYSIEAAAKSLQEYIDDHGIAETISEWMLEDCISVAVEGPAEVKRVVVRGDA